MDASLENPPFVKLSHNWMVIHNTAFRAMAQETAAIARRNIDPAKSGLHNRTGKLRNSIKVKRFVQLTPSSEAYAIISAGNNKVPYAAIHEKGGTITAKRVPYLVFTYKGRVFRKRSVFIPARPYLQPAIDEILPQYETYFGRAYKSILGERLG